MKSYQRACNVNTSLFFVVSLHEYGARQAVLALKISQKKSWCNFSKNNARGL